MAGGIDPKVDLVFKKLFGSVENKALLISLLRAVLPDSPAVPDPIADVEIMNPYNDQETLDEKLSILDVKARDQSGRQYNIEMQMRLTAFYENRSLYYWAALHKEQMQAGQDYDELHPTIGIHFLDESLWPKEKEFHYRFRLRDERYPHIELSNQLEIHVIQLPKFRLDLPDLRTPQDQWCYFLRHGEALSQAEAIEESLRPEIQQAVKVLKHMDADVHERARYESRLKAQRDQRMREKTALGKGLERGLKKGLKQGLKQGLEKGMEKGLEKGMEKGMEKGLEKGLQEGLALALEVKFGEAGQALTPMIQAIDDTAELRELKQKLIGCQTVEEFRDRLTRPS